MRLKFRGCYCAPEVREEIEKLLEKYVSFQTDIKKLDLEFNNDAVVAIYNETPVILITRRDTNHGEFIIPTKDGKISAKLQPMPHIEYRFRIDDIVSISDDNELVQKEKGN